MKLKDIIQYFNNLYPEHLKASYDNVGLMVGDREKDINRVFIALDLTKETLAEAKELGADLIVTHHPLLFYPLYNIDYSKNTQSIVVDLIKNDIAVYSMHTNFDTVKMNNHLGNLLGLKDMEVLSEKEQIGVVGNLEREMVLSSFISMVKEKYGIESCDYYGDIDATIRRVAITGGSGSSLYRDAKAKGSDIYITGDISYSRGLESKGLGQNLLDIGHFAERLFADVIVEDLEKLDKTLIKEKSKNDFVPYVRY